MTFEQFNRLLGEVFNQFLTELLTEVLFKHLVFDCLFFFLLDTALMPLLGCARLLLAVLDRACAQVPQHDVLII